MSLLLSRDRTEGVSRAGEGCTCSSEGGWRVRKEPQQWEPQLQSHTGVLCQDLVTDFMWGRERRDQAWIPHLELGP